MDAALSASDETVFFLLSLGANPDKTINDDYTALMAAIESKCVTTIHLLAPVTQVNLGGALVCLARDKVDVTTRELRQLVERAVQYKEAAFALCCFLCRKLPKGKFKLQVSFSSGSFVSDKNI